MNDRIQYFSLDEVTPWGLEIVNKHPLLYLEHDSEIPYGENPCNLRCGFEFGVGWAALADEFSQTASELVVVLRESGIQSDAYIHAFIFKEKFGELRWQGNHNLKSPFSRLFSALVHNLQMSSANTCERCGKHGERRDTGGWFRTLCDEHTEEYRKSLGNT